MTGKYIENHLELLEIINTIPAAETAKMAIVRPTTRFEIVTADNPDMARTLELQEQYIQSNIGSIQGLSTEQISQKRKELIREFQKPLSQQAFKEQQGLLAKMAAHGVPTPTILEDKGNLETAEFDYFTDMIFATDTGQYYDRDGELCFIQASFKNKQRQGEERLATAQAVNIGATVQTLVGKNGEPLTFEGGDIRQMPGKKLFLIGQGHRSHAETSIAVAKMTGYYVLPIKLLQEQFYHLDCCFLPLPNDSAVIYEGEYVLDEKGNQVFDQNGWPVITAGTESMTEESRALIRTLYAPEKLVLISKEEALAFATNAAVLQSSTDNRFKMFLNGDRSLPITDEKQAIKEHRISYTAENLKRIVEVTDGCMDLIETPYSTMHGSGGSVRCTVQEVACTIAAMTPHKTKGGHFINSYKKLVNNVSNIDSKEMIKELVYGALDVIEKPKSPAAGFFSRSRSKSLLAHSGEFSLKTGSATDSSLSNSTDSTISADYLTADEYQDASIDFSL